MRTPTLLYRDSNIVVAGARSSISVQAWEMGAHLLLLYDRTRLNTSAMREQDDIIFCGDDDELRDGILCCRCRKLNKDAA